jgi:membrane-associated phospholipid phosphatase
MSIRTRLGTATAVLILLTPGASFAQDSSLVFTQGESLAVPSDALLKTGGEPQKTFFTRHDLLATGIAAAVTGGVMVFDKKIAKWTQSPHVQGSQSRYNTVKNLTRLNETPLTIAAVATYGVGRLSHSQTAADVGLHWTEALIFTDVISQAIRGPLGRARPRVTENDDYNPFVFHPFRGFTDFGYRAFPSLHSAVGFATAAALVGEIRERNQDASRWAAPPLYALALVPGLTRMYLNQHWASDVISGAFIGQLIGSRVVHYAHTHKRTKLDRALLATWIAPDDYGRMLVTVDVQSLFGGGGR